MANSCLCESRLLLSGDMGQNPGRMQRDDSRALWDSGDRGREFWSCSQGHNPRLSAQRLLLSGDVELNPGPKMSARVEYGEGRVRVRSEKFDLDL